MSKAISSFAFLLSALALLSRACQGTIADSLSSRHTLGIGKSKACSEDLPRVEVGWLDLGEEKSYCFKKGISCIRYKINITTTNKPPSIISAFITTNYEMKNNTKKYKSSYANILEESICVNFFCDLYVTIDKTVDWSLVVLNKIPIDSPFEDDSSNQIMFQIEIQECSEKNHDIWFLCLMSLIAISCLCMITAIGVCCLFRGRNKEVVRKVEKEKNIFDMLPRHSYSEEGYQIKTLPISFTPESPMALGVAATWVTQCSFSESSQDDTEHNSDRIVVTKLN